ncbi:hypothetical protein BDP81DRAFT_417642 [Colletotrichum phormii]|uniref:Uncharacterized protein n=1 Tax=Colletotrichum phormii TaxID=359342 RepID=A0AAJ0EHW4_9PEZI|nr:uncharacterized protein BDP81DRAFT_417642 [Colletotrichum phormii]KAK1640912.1 hypothetical protein BDP81DRAFT_417642 [Colletotrichum phormii]
MMSWVRPRNAPHSQVSAVHWSLRLTPSFPHPTIVPLAQTIPTGPRSTEAPAKPLTSKGSRSGHSSRASHSPKRKWLHPK